MSLYGELKRRNVFRVAIAYLALAWLLTEVAGTLFPGFGIPAWAFRFVVIILAFGFIPTLIFSWAYEITPEGVKREKDVVRDVSITHLTAKRLDMITISLIAVALAFLLADRFLLSPKHEEQMAAPATVVADSVQAQEPGSSAPQYPSNSIAVLPFVNMSDDAANEYFSDGISEELLNLLAKIPELRVTSRSSAFSFKGKDIDIRTIATQLNVAYILEGSVRKDDNQVRITAQLIEARSDTHLWSEAYDRELVNIFKVQDEISMAIIGALKGHLGLEIEAAPLGRAAANTEAHDAYLRGRHLIVQRTRATMEGAVKELEKAIDLDPDYALAHAELAMATLLSSRYADLTDTEAIARAIPHIKRSLALDPNLAEAHAARGLIFAMQGEYEEALTQYERALQINPNYSTVHSWMGGLLADLGRYEESNAMKESALLLDPVSMVAITNYVTSLIRQNRLDDARRELEKLASIAPALYARQRGELTSVGGKWAHELLGILDALEILPENRLLRFYLPRLLAVLDLENEVLAISDNPFPYSLLYLGKPGDAVTTAKAHLAENPTSNYVRRDLGLALAAVGDYIRARPLLEEIWRKSGGRVAYYGGLFRVDDAAALIAIRSDAGEEAGVDELLVAIRDNVRRFHEADLTGTTMTLNANFDEGLADFLAGEREKGLALIAKAEEKGYFILPKVAYLQTLYDDPGFAPIIARQEARQARERNRFLSIVCIDNPYKEIWQPAEGTCERFLVEAQN
jgi:TolB-like protein/Tfp pilus assembly protein PilF